MMNTDKPRQSRLERLENIVVSAGGILAIGGLTIATYGIHTSNTDIIPFADYMIGAGAVSFFIGSIINIYRPLR